MAELAEATKFTVQSELFGGRTCVERSRQLDVCRHFRGLNIHRDLRRTRPYHVSSLNPNLIQTTFQHQSLNSNTVQSIV
jgi:hypothetical protein